MTYLRYSDDIETIQPNEQESIDGIIQGMSQQTETVEKREGHAVRASHAKSSACVIGELTIAPGLPPELAQGVFATPGTHPVAIRFAQGPGETLGDRVSTHRGMAIKIFDVPAKKIGAAVPLPEGFKSAVSSLARNVNKALHAVGTESPKADFFGHPFSHPLAEPYFSQCPIRYGDYVAKLGAFPASSEQAALKDWELDAKQDEDGFRHAAVRYFGEHDAAFELRVQLWANAETQPIEDTSVDWPQEDSRYLTVGTIRIPRQEAYSAARVRYYDDVMTFRPAHALAAHRPLGSVMRARLQVYQALSKLRHGENGIKAENTAAIDQIPA